MGKGISWKVNKNETIYTCMTYINSFLGGTMNTIITPNETDQTYIPINGIIFDKKIEYKYNSQMLGKIMDIFCEDRYTWMQWIFHFEHGVFCFSQDDVRIHDIVPVHEKN